MGSFESIVLAAERLSIYLFTYMTKTPHINAIPADMSQFTLLLTTPLLVPPFCATAVLVAPADEQLAVPQLQPSKQQPPPTLAAQVDHPVAQGPVGLATVAAGPRGTTIVLPSVTIVVELVAGQNVV